MNCPGLSASAKVRLPCCIQRLRVALVAAVCLLTAAGCGGCQPENSRSRGGRSATGSARRAQSEILLAGVGEILNELPERVDMKLKPAQPLLTAQSSADGKPVLATITRNPASPDSGINYLRLATGNANFRALEVQPLDVVRLYYANADSETAERGLTELTSLELPIRRVDAADPENALVLEGSLNGQVLVPERIEIWRYSDKRMEEIAADLTRYEQIRMPPVGWEPTADTGALTQLIERSNQWLRSLPDKPAAWAPAALIDRLPESVRTAKGVAPALTPESLAGGQFAEFEGRMLQQAVWMRDLADWARGAAVTDADSAAALFDWTVRNIQLDDAAAARTVHFPWQAVMYGHGSATHRSWVFAELCRQLGIPAVMVAFAPDADAEPTRVLPAAVVDDELLLFDPEYGLPLPGDAGPATLSEVQAHPELLRRFDLPGRPYPLDAPSMAHVTAQIVATPLQLSRRAQLLEDALEGTQIVTLSAHVDSLQARLEKLPGIDAATLWPGAFDGLAESHATPPKTRVTEVAQFRPLAQLPELWKARTLHFQGLKDVPREMRNDPLAAPKDGHREAVGLYQHRRVRLSDSLMRTLAAEKQIIYGASKQAASYWLGLLSYDRGNLRAANSWLGERSFAAYPRGRWREGARYNWARTLHRRAQGDDAEQAIELLAATPPDAPTFPGNQVLARQWREELAGPAEAESVEGAGDEDPAGESGEDAPTTGETEAPATEPGDAEQSE